MLTVYERLMPLRILEEIRFWKMQESEHTTVIRELVPSLAPEYRKLLEQWENVLAQTEKEAENAIRTILAQDKHTTDKQLRDLRSFVIYSLEQTREFIRHLHLLMQHNPDIAANPVQKTVMIHIIRESEYFIGVMDELLHSNRSPFDSMHQSDHASTSATGQHTGIARSLGQTDGIVVGGSLYRSDNLDVQRPVPIGGHKLPPLPYPYDALEPYIDEQTMRLHHQKHHAGYVDGLNTAEKMMKTARETGDFALLKHWQREAAFHGAGHYLHTIFWHVMSPDGGGKPEGAVARQIEQDFGSFERFKRHFSQAAEKVEGGGWAILVWSPRSHRLEILQAEKHQNLSQWDVVPLLVLDVWEHAYYVKYQNERNKYVEAWWNTVNWDHVNERFQAARKLKWTPY